MEEELYHHGILGQKWGVRRYQNADGSLTTNGKEHYRKTIINPERYERGDGSINRKQIDSDITSDLNTRKAIVSEIQEVSKKRKKNTTNLTIF